MEYMEDAIEIGQFFCHLCENITSIRQHPDSEKQVDMSEIEGTVISCPYCESSILAQGINLRS
ncbi:MAG: hypothetical protein ACLFQK_11115 [Fibrobacterota bacterium]